MEISHPNSIESFAIPGTLSAIQCLHAKYAGRRMKESEGDQDQIEDGKEQGAKCSEPEEKDNIETGNVQVDSAYETNEDEINVSNTEEGVSDQKCITPNKVDLEPAIVIDNHETLKETTVKVDHEDQVKSGVGKTDKDTVDGSVVFLGSSSMDNMHNGVSNVTFYEIDGVDVKCRKLDMEIQSKLPVIPRDVNSQKEVTHRMGLSSGSAESFLNSGPMTKSPVQDGKQGRVCVECDGDEVLYYEDKPPPIPGRTRKRNSASAHGPKSNTHAKSNMSLDTQFAFKRSNSHIVRSYASKQLSKHLRSNSQESIDACTQSSGPTSVQSDITVKIKHTRSNTHTGLYLNTSNTSPRQNSDAVLSKSTNVTSDVTSRKTATKSAKSVTFKEDLVDVKQPKEGAVSLDGQSRSSLPFLEKDRKERPKSHVDVARHGTFIRQLCVCNGRCSFHQF